MLPKLQGEEWGLPPQQCGDMDNGARGVPFSTQKSSNLHE